MHPMRRPMLPPNATTRVRTAPARRVLAARSLIGSTRITTYVGHLVKRVSANGLRIGACAQLATENSDLAPNLLPVATTGVPGAVVFAGRTAANRRRRIA